jgi:hypothetical protein
MRLRSKRGLDGCPRECTPNAAAERAGKARGRVSAGGGGRSHRGALALVPCCLGPAQELRRALRHGRDGAAQSRLHGWAGARPLKGGGSVARVLRAARETVRTFSRVESPSHSLVWPWPSDGSIMYSQGGTLDLRAPPPGAPRFTTKAACRRRRSNRRKPSGLL